jgi:tetratricopeptide (TPR) repeat protein
MRSALRSKLDVNERRCHRSVTRPARGRIVALSFVALFGCKRTTTGSASPPAVVDVRPVKGSTPSPKIERDREHDGESSDRDTDEARRLFAECKAHFERTDYPRALECFQAANRIAPRAELLYDIGRTLELMGRKNEAADVYEKYLETGLSHTDRMSMELRIKTLRGGP